MRFSASSGELTCPGSPSETGEHRGGGKVERVFSRQEVIQRDSQGVNVGGFAHAVGVLDLLRGMYSKVPMAWPTRVRTEPPTLANSRASPKSMIFTQVSPDKSCLSSRFSGLRSRCTIPAWWTCANPAAPE